MADRILGSKQQSFHNYGAFGLQGLNHEAMILNADLTVYIRVYADRDVTLSIGGTPGLSRNGIIGTFFDFIIYTSSAPFTITVDPNGNVSTAGAQNRYVLRRWRHYHNSPRAFTYYFDDMKLNNPNNRWSNPAGTPAGSDYINIGKVDKYIKTTSDANGYVYLCGTSYGEYINRYVTMSSVKVAIPNLRSILSYFPGAKCRNSTEWPPNAVPGGGRSLDATGGYFQQLSSSKWTDRKNTKNDSSKSTVFLHNGTDFKTIAPLIGNK